MPGIQAILLGIDGCLLDPSGKLLSPGHFADYVAGIHSLASHIYFSNRYSFPALKPPICFCTGRPQAYVEAVAYMLGLPNSWSIVESGLFLYNPATKVKVMNPALTSELMQVFKHIAEEIVPAILLKFPTLFLYSGNELNIAIEQKYGADTPMEECYASIVNALTDDVKEMVNIHHSDSAVDISPVGIDKGSGVKMWADFTGTDLAKTLGIGDSQGDFPMFEKVGKVACPANASESCKKLVGSHDGYVSPYQLTAGVADIIDHFCRGTAIDIEDVEEADPKMAEYLAHHVLDLGDIG